MPVYLDDNLVYVISNLNMYCNSVSMVTSLDVQSINIVYFSSWRKQIIKYTENTFFSSAKHFFSKIEYYSCQPWLENGFTQKQKWEHSTGLIRGWQV